MAGLRAGRHAAGATLDGMPSSPRGAEPHFSAEAAIRQQRTTFPQDKRGNPVKASESESRDGLGHSLKIPVLI